MSLRPTLRGDAVSPFSLFAFQDIVFAVTGILLLTAVFFALASRVERFSRLAPLDADAAGLLARIDAENAQRHELLQGLRTLEVALESMDGKAIETAVDTALLSTLDASALAEENRPLHLAWTNAQRDVQERIRAVDAQEQAWDALQARMRRLEHVRDHILLRLPEDQRAGSVLAVVSQRQIRFQSFARPEDRFVLSVDADAQSFQRALEPHRGSSTRLFAYFSADAAGNFARVHALARDAGVEVIARPLGQGTTVAVHTVQAARELLP
jgi:hypothetical protein